MPRLLLVLTLLTAGCATDREFGAVVNRNIANQTVDLSPTYAGVPIEGSSGVRSVSAVERYLERKTAPLARASSTSQIGGASGGGSGPQN